MIKDPYKKGIAGGWKVVDAARLTSDREDEADVVIVGSGAGGGNWTDTTWTQFAVPDPLFDQRAIVGSTTGSASPTGVWTNPPTA